MQLTIVGWAMDKTSLKLNLKLYLLHEGYIFMKFIEMKGSAVERVTCSLMVSLIAVLSFSEQSTTVRFIHTSRELTSEP